jgi:hypothetical protein
VERFMGQADAATKLAAFQRSASWQQSQLLEHGWATATGSTNPNVAVAQVVRPTAREPQNLAALTGPNPTFVSRGAIPVP